MEISKKSLAVNLTESLAANLSGTAFVKMTVVYGHIDENGRFVRKN
ncbi:hypothetical protein GKD00_09055 [Lactobacillus ruminis]|nr:hypothetical protein [Ligilactobacillus ruminis]MSB44734.1 hypothetical protein [Ligilactobacillus ruminis]MSB55084.1 hypothetical protein [Ligilactobacillus ruminis]MSB57049.1 hypothetical protein [Ligilactobacillus ruminis]MSB82091.1 hypothetical protein [Ligilactobacillus ruminis]MSB91738.1 hypothetical protein [Ligilactobacillus ruminis]